ncbi:MAG: hypothetical protein LBT04_01990 [Prevotellaceae bacterium]|jgi:microcystin-dependent protein|nr:hypothetical protein [Prevotellaceae bacterium]
MQILKRNTGNYLNFIEHNFPLDCEGLNYMQLNNVLLSVLGNIGGNKYIIKGCDNTTNYEGYIFLPTLAAPEGELLYVEQRPETSSASTLFIVTENVDISIQGYNYYAAYTQRHLAWGVGNEQFNFTEFKIIKTNVQLESSLAALQAQVNLIQPAPKGCIVMWSGSIATIPTGWSLCNGNNGVAINGVQIPDLRGKFIAGYNSDDSDYNTVGKTGGVKQVALTLGQIPFHSHSFTLAPANSAGSNFTYAAAEKSNSTAGSQNTDSTGAGQAHENRPPYYTLAYIIKTS